MADHPFTPHADSIQTAWVLMCQQSRIATQPPVEELEAEFDRFLARVRRDAAESTYAAAYRAGWLDGQNGSLPDPRMAYPEETP